MPFYEYECSCGQTTEELRSVDNRHDLVACPCGNNMQLIIGATKLDTLHMGLDPAYPTLYKKWGDIQTAKNRGKIRDNNNNQIKKGY